MNLARLSIGRLVISIRWRKTPQLETKPAPLVAKERIRCHGCGDQILAGQTYALDRDRPHCGKC